MPIPPNGILDVQGVAALADDELVSLVRQGNAFAFRTILKRNNQRLYRLARSLLKDESEAEDAMQETYLRAFANLSDFRGDSGISTWLTRIMLNEALGRLRRRRTMIDLDSLHTSTQGADDEASPIPSPLAPSLEPDPERAAAQREIRRLLEQAIEALPESFRTVFVMRAIEQMSVDETAAYLGLRKETVKTRLHRAKRLLRQALDPQLASALHDVFPFAGARCDGFADRVLKQLGIAIHEAEPGEHGSSSTR
jgi:RNA polymerase sigma-70 factor (ECF subfamily)